MNASSIGVWAARKLNGFAAGLCRNGCAGRFLAAERNRRAPLPRCNRQVWNGTHARARHVRREARGPGSTSFGPQHFVHILLAALLPEPDRLRTESEVGLAALVHHLDVLWIRVRYPGGERVPHLDRERLDVPVPGGFD